MEEKNNIVPILTEKIKQFFGDSPYLLGPEVDDPYDFWNPSLQNKNCTSMAHYDYYDYCWDWNKDC